MKNRAKTISQINDGKSIHFIFFFQLLKCGYFLIFLLIYLRDLGPNKQLSF